METRDRGELVRKLDPEKTDAVLDRFTSLQPTYEDTVPPESHEEWEPDERS